MKASKILQWFPLLSGLTVIVAAMLFSWNMLEGNSTDRQVLDWIFFLLTGFLLTLFFDVLAIRVRSSTSEKEVARSLSGYDKYLQAGITEADLGKQRVEKKLSIISKATKSVFLIGLAHSNMCSTENIKVLTGLVPDCHVRLMLLDPLWLEESNDFLHMLTEHLGRDPDVFIAQIRRTVRNLKKAHGALPKASRKKFNVRTYRAMPANNFALIDKDRPNSLLILELLPFHCGFRNRPHLILRPSDKGWYSTLCIQMEELWNSGTDIFNEQ